MDAFTSAMVFANHVSEVHTDLFHNYVIENRLFPKYILLPLTNFLNLSQTSKSTHFCLFSFQQEYFRVSDFLNAGKQPNLTADMLTTLADWLVEVQENFALNHETIHLAWGLLYAYLDRGQPLARYVHIQGIIFIPSFHCIV